MLDALEQRGCAATAACSRSTATRTASTRSGCEDGAPVVVEVLSAGALERRADPRGARVRRRARRARDSGRRAALHRRDGRRCTASPASASPSSAPRRPRARARRPRARSNGSAASSAASTPSARRGRSSIAPALDIARLRRRAARLPAGARLHSGRPARRPGQRVVDAGAGRRARTASSAPAQSRRLRLHGDCHAGNVLWTDDGPHFVDFDDARMGPAVQDLWMLLSGDRARDGARSCATCSPATRTSPISTARELHLVEALRTLRLIHYSALARAALGRPGVSGRVSRGSTPSATGRTASSNCASRSR